MFRLIIILILLALISIGAAWFAENDGVIYIEWLEHSIELTVNFAVYSTVILLISLPIVIFLFFFVVNTPSRIRKKQNDHKNKKAWIEVEKAMASLMIGNTAGATRHTNQIFRLLGDNNIYHMIAAQTAHLNNDNEKEKEHLSALLLNKDPERDDIKNAAMKGLLSATIKEGKFNEAASFAEKSYKEGKERIVKFPELLTLYMKSGRWEDAALLTERQGRRPSAFFSLPERKKLNEYKSLIAYARGRKSYEDNNLEQAYELLSESVRMKPDFIAAVILLADVAVITNNKRKAVSAIEKAWRKQPHHQLADKYFGINKDYVGVRRLKLALKLNSLNKNHWESHMAVARAALDAGNLNMARNHIRMAAEIKETVSLCNFMIEVENAETPPDNETIKEWSERGRKASSDPVWECESCGRKMDKWLFECNYCGAIGRIKPEQLRPAGTNLIIKS